jgi:pimeloyl-ACP methyl ester carboxylesterase
MTTACAPVARRMSFTFAPGGGYAAWLRSGPGREPLTLEGLALRGTGDARPMHVNGPPALDLNAQLLALDDGRVLLCVHEGDIHRVLLVGVRRCTPIAELQGRGLRLLSAPAPATARHGPLAFAISVTDAGESTLWRLDETRGLNALLSVPSMLGASAWLDASGSMMAINRIIGGRPSDVVALDLRSGDCSPFFSISPRSNDRVLACSAVTGLIAVSTDATGRERVGYGMLGRLPVRFPKPLHRPDDCRVLGVDPLGRHLLVSEQRGAVSELSVYDPESDQLAPVPTEPGTVVGPASWHEHTLRVPWSTPTAPHAIARVQFGRHGPSWALDTREPGCWAAARLERFAGPAGEIEAVVYGGTDWRRSQRLVIALHGGPLAHWNYAFDQLFQSLAAAGVAIVAPNQRGSTGYGSAHMLAIRDDWGGPDVDDILHLARALHAERRDVPGGELTVLGSSYGGFLALLAAQAAPELWTRSIALAPFTSTKRLYADGWLAVRRLIERLGGLAESRDVLVGAEALAANPLLLVHGECDGQIPVSHSRMLASRLRDLGADITYHELPGESHDLGNGRHRELVYELVTSFCLRRPERAR